MNPSIDFVLYFIAICSGKVETRKNFIRQPIALFAFHPVQTSECKQSLECALNMKIKSFVELSPDETIQFCRILCGILPVDFVKYCKLLDSEFFFQ